jgi:glycerate kinase
MAHAVHNLLPGAEVTIIPMADGGEGTIDALVSATAGERLTLRAAGPLGEQTDTYIGIVNGDTAILEAANIAGLTMVPLPQRNPLHTTSRGLGELIRHALDRGFRKLVIGLGGSATNDGGLGMLLALGAVFNDEEGRVLQGFGRDLAEVYAVDFSPLDPRLNECSITIASDVSNPLCGSEGASRIFGPQKGASPAQIELFDLSLERYADLVEQAVGKPLKAVPGAGSAGGLGFALLAIGAAIIPGAELVDRMTGLREKLKGADWVLTGEGRSDGQSLYGKLPLHVAKAAKEEGVGSILISGSLGEGHELLRDYFAGCFALVTEPCSLKVCMDQAERLLASCTENVIGFLKQTAGRSNPTA